MLDSQSKSLPISIKPQVLSFKSLGLDLRITPSLSLPRAPHIPPGRAKKAEKFGFFGFFVDHLAFRNALEKRLRKNIEKSAKIEEFGLPKPFQNPSKTPLKTMFQQTCDFSAIFMRKRLCRKSADIDFVLNWFFQYFLLVGHFSSNRFWHGFWVQKTFQKPVQNHLRAVLKSMLKMHRFSTSIFSCLGLDFGASWASKLELCWLKILPQGFPAAPLEPS